MNSPDILNDIVIRVIEWVSEYATWLYAASGVAIVICALSFRSARRDKKRTIFKLERELAVARETRALSLTFLFLGITVAVTAIKFQLTPNFEAMPKTPTPTATRFLFEEPPTRAVSPTPTVTNTPLPVPVVPTLAPATRTPTPPGAPPTPTSPPPPVVSCPSAGVCIRSPGSNARLSGVVQIQGTAAIDRFQFYKVEYGAGENPQSWNSINEIRRQPVQNGLLETWNTTGFPPGVYKLRLTVVDITGNFTTPHEVRVILGQ